MLTPTGVTKHDAIDPATIADCWISSTSFPNLVAYSTDPIKSTSLNNMIIAACAGVNRICNRKFNQQIIDEIWPNMYMFTSQYNEFVLKNRPLISLDHVWLEIAANFSEVQSTYLQVMTDEAIVKILPTVMTTALTPYPFYLKKDACNVWIEYTSGYTSADVPSQVQIATALYVDYLYGVFDAPAGIESFRTQTYSQNNATPDKDPKLTQIRDMLRPYILYSVK